MKIARTVFSAAFLAPLTLAGMLTSYSDDAQATAAFAIATGSKCNKCHTVSFPRLTARGERFMRNGFQIKKESDGGFGLDDDQPKEDKLLRKLNEIVSVTGDFKLAELKAGTTSPQLGTPESVGFLATGNLGKNTPLWVGADISAEGAEIHRYTIGRTNVLDSTLVNFRAGTIDPTTWTSFYGHGGALDTPSGDIGAYGAGHHSTGSNFSTVGPGYNQRNGVEYYGYNDWLIWSAGLANGDTGEDEHTETTTDTHTHGAAENFDQPDYWASARIDFLKGSSASVLWYNANGAIEKQAATGALNIRYGKLDLRTQFTLDVTKNSDSKNAAYGATLQADYAITKRLMGIYRYDTTDNGEAGGVESQMTLAMVVRPLTNVKVTASYIFEQDVAAATDVHDEETTDETHVHDEGGLGNRATLALRYMF